MPESGLNQQQRKHIESGLSRLQRTSHTPEAMGWSINDFVLSEAASRGTLNGTELTIPFTITVSLPEERMVSVPGEQSATDSGLMITCVKTCVTAFGIELFCSETCDTNALTVTHSE